MNRKQRMAMIVGGIVFVGMIAFPPWVMFTPQGGKYGAGRYSFIGIQPKGSYSCGYQIDYAKLGIQLVAVGVITGVTVALMNKPHPPAE